MTRTMLTNPDPRKSAVKAKIMGCMAALGLTQEDLTVVIGKSQSSISRCLGKQGDVGELRLKELWAIEDYFKAHGLGEEK